MSFSATMPRSAFTSEMRASAMDDSYVGCSDQPTRPSCRLLMTMPGPLVRALSSIFSFAKMRIISSGRPKVAEVVVSISPSRFQRR